MGVRGKIEAVIYAAEEPVTLALLSALFGEEALAERSAAESLAAEAADGSNNGTDEGVAEQLALETADAQTELQNDAPISEPVNQPSELEPSASGLEHGPIASTEATGEDAEAVRLEAAPDEEAEKRAARARERQQREAVRAELTALMADYDAGDRGMEIREIAGGYRVATKPEYHDAVRAFAKSLKPPMKLTLQALETLAVIAYKQPVTAPEVSEIRGVDSGGVMGSLISRKLVTTAGRKQVLGRPILYKTTKEFLLRFGLKDLAELPSMEEFEKMAGELQGLSDEPEGAAELAPTPTDAAASDDELNAEAHVPAAEGEAPASETTSAGEHAGTNVALEVPQEPAQSVIVVDDAEPVEHGMQVTEDGTAVSDGAGTPDDAAAEPETPAVPEGYDREEASATSDEKEESNHG